MCASIHSRTVTYTRTLTLTLTHIHTHTHTHRLLEKYERYEADPLSYEQYSPPAGSVTRPPSTVGYSLSHASPHALDLFGYLHLEAIYLTFTSPHTLTHTHLTHTHAHSHTFTQSLTLTHLHTPSHIHTLNTLMHAHSPSHTHSHLLGDPSSLIRCLPGTILSSKWSYHCPPSSAKTLQVIY